MFRAFFNFIALWFILSTAGSAAFALDPYAILGVPQDATREQIQSAYRKIALNNHPDRNPDDAAAEERFKQASAAWDLLKDPNKRARYDSGRYDLIRDARWPSEWFKSGSSSPAGSNGARSGGDPGAGRNGGQRAETGPEPGPNRPPPRSASEEATKIYSVYMREERFHQLWTDDYVKLSRLVQNGEQLDVFRTYMTLYYRNTRSWEVAKLLQPLLAGIRDSRQAELAKRYLKLRFSSFSGRDYAGDFIYLGNGTIAESIEMEPINLIIRAKNRFQQDFVGAVLDGGLPKNCDPYLSLLPSLQNEYAAQAARSLVDRGDPGALRVFGSSIGRIGSQADLERFRAEVSHGETYRQQARSYLLSLTPDIERNGPLQGLAAINNEFRLSTFKAIVDRVSDSDRKTWNHELLSEMMSLLGDTENENQAAVFFNFLTDNDNKDRYGKPYSVHLFNDKSIEVYERLVTPYLSRVQTPAQAEAMKVLTGFAMKNDRLPKALAQSFMDRLATLALSARSESQAKFLQEFMQAMRERLGRYGYYNLKQQDLADLEKLEADQVMGLPQEAQDALVYLEKRGNLADPLYATAIRIQSRESWSVFRDLVDQHISDPAIYSYVNQKPKMITAFMQYQNTEEDRVILRRLLEDDTGHAYSMWREFIQSYESKAAYSLSFRSLIEPENLDDAYSLVSGDLWAAATQRPEYNDLMQRMKSEGVDLKKPSEAALQSAFDRYIETLPLKQRSIFGQLPPNVQARIRRRGYQAMKQSLLDLRITARLVQCIKKSIISSTQ